MGSLKNVHSYGLVSRLYMRVSQSSEREMRVGQSEERAFLRVSVSRAFKSAGQCDSVSRACTRVDQCLPIVNACGPVSR